MESFCRVDALASLHKVSGLTTANSKESACLPAILLPAIFQTLRQIMVTEINIKAVQGSKTSLTSGFLFNDCFDGASFSAIPSVRYNESDHYHSRLIGSAGLCNGACLNPQRHEALFWIPDTPLYKLVRMENTSPREGEHVYGTAIPLLKRINQHKGAFVILKDYVFRTIIGESPKTRKKSNNSRSEPYKNGLQEIRVDPPPTLAFISYLATPSADKGLLEKLVYSEVPVPRAVDFLVCPPKFLQEDDPTREFLLKTLKSNRRLAEALLEVQDSNHPELLKFMPVVQGVPELPLDTKLRAALTVILPDHHGLACCLYTIFQGIGLNAKTIATELAERFANKINNKGQGANENTSELRYLIIYFTAPGDVKLANCMVWAALESFELAYKFLKHILLQPSSEDRKNLINCAYHILTKSVKDLISFAKYYVEDRAVPVNAGVAAWFKDEQTMDEHRDDITNFIENDLKKNTKDISPHLERCLSSSRSSANAKPVSSSFTDYFTGTESFVYKTAGYIPRYHIPGSCLPVTLGQTVKTSEDIYNQNEFYNYLKRQFQVLIAIVTNIKSFISEYCNVVKPSSFFTFETALEETVVKGETTFPELADNIYDALFDAKPSPPDSELEDSQGITGLLFGSLALAFVLRDYCDREKKIHEQIEKMHTFYTEKYTPAVDASGSGSQQTSATTLERLETPQADLFFKKLRDNKSLTSSTPQSSYYVLKESIMIAISSSSSSLEHSYKAEIQGDHTPYFFDMPLEKGAKTIKDMDDLVFNIEALLVHDITLDYLHENNIKATANCFSRTDDRDGSGYKLLNEYVHSVPRNTKTKMDEYGLVYRGIHDYTIKSHEAEHGVLKKVLRDSDPWLVNVSNKVALESFAALAANANSVKLRFLKKKVIQ